MFTLSYAAGLYVGEGSVGVSPKGNPVLGRRYISATMSSTDEDILDAFRQATGLGSVTGPHRPYRDHYQPVWHWSLCGEAPIRELAVMLWPWLNERRKQQFEEALMGVRTSKGPGLGLPADMPEPQPFDLAYAGGVYVGEGSVSGGSGPLGRGWYLTAKIDSTDRDIIEAVQSVLGGNISGPFGPYEKETHKPQWRWTLGGNDAVADLAARLEPWLNIRRRQQFEEALQRAHFVKRVYHRNDNCRRGHPLTPENTYSRIALDTGRRDHSCKQCKAMKDRERHQRNRAALLA